jgi:hypothetical protein
MKFFRPALILLASAATLLGSQVKTPFVRVRGNALVYEHDAQGNGIPDFSGAGYRGGGVPLPTVPARVTVTPAPGDNRARIQAALDHVASLPPDANGFRGAVQLLRGRFEIAGQLRLSASGVVLRGSGAADDGTVLVATGTDRRALIVIAGTGHGTKSGSARAVEDDYVPVGATAVTLSDVNGLKAGDRVLIERPSTKAWIAAIGMNDAAGRQPFAWQPGRMDLVWERTVVAIDGRRVKLDAPLTTALDRGFGAERWRRLRGPAAWEKSAWKICTASPSSTASIRVMSSTPGWR